MQCVKLMHMFSNQQEGTRDTKQQFTEQANS